MHPWWLKNTLYDRSRELTKLITLRLGCNYLNFLSKDLERPFFSHRQPRDVRNILKPRTPIVRYKYLALKGDKNKLEKEGRRFNYRDGRAYKIVLSTIINNKKA
ncbi:uncharacterized protein BBA_09781 [Beauveria bassiana ARSEF 2860]|uniref:Uncharacterized protein n=1 Tax=Beauveria bassiana (strain ARSEF 2860) TaxID=655819 RepID=J5JBF9_BEAB2|nr:uncharacterized protein BBA_09781 [Beauveria bassiana ARSEF 2860]EJP61276.1 hypothetical protein BBA_09781 [Beauveria bassiana ARSEF 2860]